MEKETVAQGARLRRHQTLSEVIKNAMASLLLVGGIPTPVKKMKVSWDEYSQYMEKCSKPPTSLS